MHVQCTMRRAAECVNLTITVAVVLVVVVAIGTSSGGSGRLEYRLGTRWANIRISTKDICCSSPATRP